MAKSSQSPKSGFINQLKCNQCVDGVTSFNLENLLGSMFHAAMGWFIARNVRYAVAPDFESFIERVKPELRGRCVFIS